MNMTKLRWAAPLAFLAAVNVVVLAGAAWNRSGSPEASVVLTERELSLAREYSSDENSGAGFALQLCRFCEDPSWFGRAKLEALGFDVEGYLGQELRTRKRPLQRKAYAVLEYDGPAWQAALQRERRALEKLQAQVASGEVGSEHIKAAEDRLRRMQALDSRLLPVDVGRDPQILRTSYPDASRYIIAPATVRMRECRGRQCAEPAYGQVADILTGSIHVPARFHRVFDSAFGSERPWWSYGSLLWARDLEGPRYRVELHYGRRHEPWVGRIEPSGDPGGAGQK